MRKSFAAAVLILCASLLLPTTGHGQADPGAVSFIVKLKDASVASYKGGVDGLAPCSIAVTGGNRLDLTTPACLAYRAFLESKIDALEDALRERIPEARLVHRLLVVFGGVSVILPKERVPELLELPGVEAIFEDGFAQLETVASPQFIGADRLWEELGGADQAGEGIIVGVIDSGVWPESPSFSDPDPRGNAYPPPPLRWTGTACEFGSDTPGDEVFECNNKLIGAQRIMDTYDSETPSLPTEFLSARDDDGHGTHTLSTAAGNGGAEAAVVVGEPLAEISGVAPRAHAVAYKVSGASGAKFSDVTAAVQQAVEDGVDVLNYSMSGPSNPYLSAVSLAFLDAYEAGILIAASAGNSGPEADTITSREPWAIVVGNSTHDNVMAGTLEVTASNGDTLTLAGTSVTGSASGPIVISPELDNLDCMEPFAEGTFTRNEIVICIRGGQIVERKSQNVAAAGGSGVVMYNFSADSDNYRQDKHFLPFIHIGFSEGKELLEFMLSHDEAGAVLTQGAATPIDDFPGGPPSLNPGTAPGKDVMNDGSSRGGPGQTLGVSRPDITAPGTAILAGGTPLPSTIFAASQGAPGLYMFASGTSMSAPHIAGAVALLLDLHPDWTPGQIKSALMTTAFQGVVKEDGTTPADPFDRGSGRVDLRRAFEPGLTFVAPSAQDFLERENDLWNLNYPSLYLPFNPGRVTVERTVANELPDGQQWRTEVSAPPDVAIEVPKHITLPNNGTRTFDITVDGGAVPSGETRHANLRLTNGEHEANFPITFVKDDLGLPLTKSCEPTTLPRTETTACTITVTNTTAEEVAVRIHDRLDRELLLEDGVEGAERLNARELAFEGIVDGAVPPDVTVVEAPSPFGYLPLASLGFEPLSEDTLGDDDIDDFSVPPYMYGGEIHTSIGFASNGYAVAGGNTDEDEDNKFLRQIMPDPERPNNVIAPFWTDLADGGKQYIEVVDPYNSGTEWLVLEWEDMFLTGTEEDGNKFSFQIWIQVSTDQEAIFMVYGRVDDVAEGRRFSVGAENKFGNRGQTVNDEQGVPPAVGRDLAVLTTPGISGTHTITYTARGIQAGDWQSCAEMDSSAFQGAAVACAEGEVR
jgi:subtilisin family serine protease